MIDQELINKINELANKKKTVGLTEEESTLQKELRKQYLALFKEGLKLFVIMLTAKLVVYA